MLALLAEDLADMPPDLLERAIQRHVAMSPYMPKAADLIKLAQGMMEPATSLDAYAEQLNATNFSKAQGWHWFVNTRSRDDGWTERYLDRSEVQQHVPWIPDPGEVEAIDAKVARFIAANPDCTQAEFNKLVDSGRF